ncbi:MAG: aldo/keto reductase [Bacteroidales bacterium]|nr:aldo/keto reductase [Bacteroidales bacterium]
MDNFILTNNVSIPCIGLGTWENRDENTVTNTLLAALNLGYRHIDTASVYSNEMFIGKALKNCGVDRKSLFITSKVWNNNRGYSKTIKSFEKSLNDLQTDYLDLFLIHWPASVTKYDNWAELNAETWHALEDLYKSGKVKAIGVSNFWQHHLEPLLKVANICPMVNQIEYHPGYQQQNVVNFCKQNNILVEAWSPLGRGKMFNIPELIQIAEKYRVTVAQICIKWCLQNGVLPLPKSTKPERLQQNIDIDNFTISDEDMNYLNSLDLGSSSGQYPDEVDF